MLKLQLNIGLYLLTYKILRGEVKFMVGRYFPAN